MLKVRITPCCYCRALSRALRLSLVSYSLSPAPLIWRHRTKRDSVSYTEQDPGRMLLLQSFSQDTSASRRCSRKTQSPALNAVIKSQPQILTCESRPGCYPCEAPVCIIVYWTCLFGSRLVICAWRTLFAENWVTFACISEYFSTPYTYLYLLFQSQHFTAVALLKPMLVEGVQSAVGVLTRDSELFALQRIITFGDRMYP